MPIPVVCPGCRKKASAPDNAAGKAVRCPHCQHTMRIPAAEKPPEGPPPLPKAAAPAKVEEIMPATVKPHAVSRAASPHERIAQINARRQREEVESDDDRPRRRRPEPATSHSALPWIVAGVAVAAVVVMLAIGLVLFVALQSPPQEAIVVQPAPAVPIPVAVVAPAPAPDAVPPIVAKPKPVPNNGAVKGAARVGNDPLPGLPKEVAKEAAANGGIVANADDNPAPADMKPPTGKSQVFAFDGKSRIVTPLERFAPVTLEAWFRPSRDPAPRRISDRTQYLIGSDIPGQYGYGVGIRYDGNTLGGLQMETMRTFFNSNTPISTSGWSHVAAVFAPTEVAIYFNGKPAFKQVHNLEILGGTTFAIGKSGRDATVPFFFSGDIREIRISNGTRYNQEFTPPTAFQKDATSALIYRASDTNGKTAIDLSGNGRDGELDGVIVAGEDDKVAPKSNPVVVAGAAKEYEPKSKRFTITMPPGVKTEQVSRSFAITLPAGLKGPIKGLPPRPSVNAEVAASHLADGTKFIASYIGMPAVLLREVPEDRRHEMYREVFLKSANGTIVSEAEINQGRFKGKDYLIDLPQGQMRMQLMMLGGAGCYAMVESSSIERLAAQDVDAFFDSFKIKE